MKKRLTSLFLVFTILSFLILPIVPEIHITNKVSAYDLDPENEVYYRCYSKSPSLTCIDYTNANFDYENHTVISLNNTIPNILFRPKEDELSFNVKQTVDAASYYTNQKDAFDSFWSDPNEFNPNAIGCPSKRTRALDNLGYHYLLIEDDFSNQRLSQRFVDVNGRMTAPYFIMCLYKALNINLYETFIFETNNIRNDIWDPDIYTTFVYVANSNINKYWSKFINDHPINYDIYDNNNVYGTTVQKQLTWADVIVATAEFIDYYGEPVISKKEEYMLLQVYGNDIPNYLTKQQIDAWSYLKCRGILPENDSDIDYTQYISFDDMMDIILRVSDEKYRFNFKDVQIVTSLEDALIEKGCYETTTNIEYVPDVRLSDASIKNINPDRYDFLIEIDTNTTFKNPTTGTITNSLFIADSTSNTDKAIPGSTYHGIVRNKYYHFSIPVSEARYRNVYYINTKDENDNPSYIELNCNSFQGGIFSGYTPRTRNILYSTNYKFQDIMPESLYFDSTRESAGEQFLHAASTLTYECTINSEYINVPESIKLINNAFPNNKIDDNNVATEVQMSVGAPGETRSAIKINMRVQDNVTTEHLERSILRYIVYKYTETQFNKDCILNIHGDELYLDVEDLKSTGTIVGYDLLRDKKVLYIYTKESDIIIVDGKNNVIHKGNTYIRFNDNDILYRMTDDNKLQVNFVALYGLKDVVFDIVPTTSNDGYTVRITDNKFTFKQSDSSALSKSYNFIVSKNMNGDNVAEYKRYTYNKNTGQKLFYNDKTIEMFMPLTTLLGYTNYSDFQADAGNIVVDEVLVPLSMNNPMGNYLLYQNYEKSGVLNEYILFMYPKGTVKLSDKKADVELSDLFYFMPENLDNYDYQLFKLSDIPKTEDSQSFVKNIDNVGWCLVANTCGNTTQNIPSKVQDYVEGKILSPMIYVADTNYSATLYTLNYNTSDNINWKDLNFDNYDGGTMTPAATCLQSLFTDPRLVTTINTQTISSLKVKRIFYGTLAADITKNGVVSLFADRNLKINSDGKFRALSINKYRDKNTKNIYRYSGNYMLIYDGMKVVINSLLKPETVEINRSEKELEEFFSQFDDITFSNFIKNLDNGMSIAYYIMTRVVPMIISTLLTILLLFSFISDIKIVQIFCEKVVDPVWLITFGNYNIQTMNTRVLIFSLIGALTIMGIIQAGNLELIITWLIKCFYALRRMFV